MIEIRDLLGKPYKTHGRGPDSFDCYGLAIEVCRRFGKKLDDALYENLSPDIENRLIDQTKSALKAKRISQPEAGAVVEFLIAGTPRHIGVCLGDGNFIHCNSFGVRIESLAFWSKRIEGFYTWQ